MPITARDLRPLVVDVAAEELAVGRQRHGNGERAVAGVSADLECAFRPDQAHEQREERTLIGADLHAGTRHRRRLFAQPPLEIGFAGDDGADVIFNGFGQKRAVRHEESSQSKGIKP